MPAWCFLRLSSDSAYSRKKRTADAIPSEFLQVLLSVTFILTATGSAVAAERSLVEAGFKTGILAGAGFRLRSAAGRFRSATGRLRPYTRRFRSRGFLTATAAAASAIVPAAEK